MIQLNLLYSARIISIVVLLSCVASCYPSKPSERDGETALLRIVDGGQSTRLRLVEFRKNDGRAAQVNGVRVYTLMFSAALEFDSASMFNTGNPLDRSQISTAPFHKNSTQGFSWNDFFVSNVAGFEPAQRGDRLDLNGTIDFESRESGWVPISINFKSSHDSSFRKADYGPESLERRFFSMEYASDAAPHQGLVGGYRNGDICLSILPPHPSVLVGTVHQVDVFKCNEGRDLSASFELHPDPTLLSDSETIRISSTRSRDAVLVESLKEIRNGCSTCGFSNLLIAANRSITFGRAFEVYAGVIRGD